MSKNTDDTASLLERIRQLENENAKLNNIINKAPTPLFVVDNDHRITHFNQALEELTGLDADQMIGTRDQWKAFYKKKRPVMADLIVDRASEATIFEHYGPKYQGTTGRGERFAATDFYEALGEDGTWLFFTASPFTDGHGNLEGAVETLQDVTEEKIAERKTRELFRIYRKILEFIPYPIVVYTENGDVSYLNPAFYNTFGWTLEDLKGYPLPYVPDGLKTETYSILDKLKKDKSLTRYETQRLTKDKKVLDVVIWAASHSRFKTGVTENFVILRDVTEEKRIQANNKTIMRISAALPEHPGLEDLMNFISKEVKELMNTEGAVILLYDEIKNDLFFSGASYDNQDTEERARQFRFSLDAVMAGKIIRTGEPILENDPEKLMNGFSERDRKMGYDTRSLLEVPIKSEGRIIGVLCAINKKQNRFDQNDMELMMMIAGTCAISIENARFSEALKEAYRDVASMNRAKGKAINHLSHELKTPVAVLTGSLTILKKKLEAFPEISVTNTVNRIDRNLNRVMEIQDEVADIMEDKAYSAQKILLNMLEACQDELETLIDQTLMTLPGMNSNGPASEKMIKIEETVRKMIDEKFGPRSITSVGLNFGSFFNDLYEMLTPDFEFRSLEINIRVEPDLPVLVLPVEIIEKMLSGLIKNAIENTPDKGRIDIVVQKREDGILFKVHDFGVGIEEDAKKRIFEGFFMTQDTLNYSTKTPFAFNAGGKGADLLRMKIFSDRHGFTMNMESSRCCYLLADKEVVCPGDIDQCKFCKSQEDCINSGYSVFSIFFPSNNGEKTL